MDDLIVKVDTREIDIMLDKARELKSCLDEINSNLEKMRSYGVHKKHIKRMFKGCVKMVVTSIKNKKSTKK